MDSVTRLVLAVTMTIAACGVDPTETMDSRPDTDSGSDSGGIEPVDTDPHEIVLDGEADAKLVGEDDAEGFADAFAVASAGDVDGDGIDDVLVGRADSDRGGGEASGTVYLVRGPSSGNYDLALSDAKLIGSNDEYAGAAVAGAGDVNADGFADILVGAPYFDSAGHIEGQVYLVNGPASGDVTLAMADAILHGDESACTGDGGWDPCRTGAAVAGLGDVDGDGFDDIVIGATGASTAYLIRGPVAGLVELASDADATVSDAPTLVGADVSGAGDVDGDGLHDVLVGCYSAYTDGAVLVYSSFPNGVLTRADADAIVTDVGGSLLIGTSIASAGDTNADGYADLLLAAPGDDAGAEYGGGALVFLGPLPATVDAADADAALHSAEASDYAGIDVAGAGDVNGDTYADIVIGAPGQLFLPGRAYLVHGPFAGSMSLADADYRMEGGGIDGAGDVVSAAGDIDSDGLADILIGGPYDEEGGDYSGAAWLILGASLP